MDERQHRRKGKKFWHSLIWKLEELSEKKLVQHMLKLVDKKVKAIDDFHVGQKISNCLQRAIRHVNIPKFYIQPDENYLLNEILEVESNNKGVITNIRRKTVPETDDEEPEGMLKLIFK